MPLKKQPKYFYPNALIKISIYKQNTIKDCSYLFKCIRNRNWNLVDFCVIFLCFLHWRSHNAQKNSENNIEKERIFDIIFLIN